MLKNKNTTKIFSFFLIMMILMGSLVTLIQFYNQYKMQKQINEIINSSVSS